MSSAREKIFIQTLKEFWIQILLSICWGTYKVYINSGDDKALSVFISNFSASLFLLSWMFGQVVRIKKQQKIEGEFGLIKDQIKSLLKKIEVQTKDLIGFATGGDSIAFFQPGIPLGTQIVQLDLINTSTYPVFDFHGDYIDLDEPIDSENGVFWTRHQFNLGSIYPNKIMTNVFRFDLANQNQLRINVFAHSRNRMITQLIRVAKVNGQLLVAFMIISKDYKEVSVPPNFPNYDSANPESVFD